MRVSVGDGSGRSRGGFSLLEVVIAAALLLLTVTAVSSTVVGVSRAGARLRASMDADRAMRSVAERLRTLPYCASSYPQPLGGSGDEGADLLAAVFPHADSAQNAQRARYVAAADDDGGAPAGSFVTLLTRDGVLVQCVAWFQASPDGPRLGPEKLAGWDVAESDAPPAPTLSLTLSVDPGGRCIRVVRSALSVPSIAASPTLLGGG